MTLTIQDLVDAGELCLWHDYRNADENASTTVYDQATNDPLITKNNGVTTDTVWTGDAITFPEASTSEVLVAHDERLSISDEKTFILFSSPGFDVPTSIQSIFGKSGGASYELFCYWNVSGPLTGVFLHDGANTRSCIATTSNFENKRCIAIGAKSGATPNLYLDGALLGAFSGAVAITTNTEDLYIGNDGINRAALGSPLSSVLIVDRLLSAQEHADIYAELVARYERRHDDNATARLLNQFANSPNIQAVLRAAMRRFDNVDYVLRYLRDYTSIDTATGVWLDVLGDILGIPRPHIEYPYSQIFAFRSEGVPSDPFKGFAIAATAGTERVTNGEFDTDISGWIVTESGMLADVDWSAGNQALGLAIDFPI